MRVFRKAADKVEQILREEIYEPEEREAAARGQRDEQECNEGCQK
jgi:hypothetical protein